jgi:hypothetical protein
MSSSRTLRASALAQPTSYRPSGSIDTALETRFLEI